MGCSCFGLWVCMWVSAAFGKGMCCVEPLLAVQNRSQPSRNLFQGGAAALSSWDISLLAVRGCGMAVTWVRISWLCCLEIQSKPASVHLLRTSETGCCRAAGPARNHSQVYLKYTPQLSPCHWMGASEGTYWCQNIPSVSTFLLIVVFSASAAFWTVFSF